jgi:hypothetical protein
VSLRLQVEVTDPVTQRLWRHAPATGMRHAGAMPCWCHAMAKRPVGRDLRPGQEARMDTESRDAAQADTFSLSLCVCV